MLNGHRQDVAIDRCLWGFPAILALYFRLTISETPRYTMEMDADDEQVRADTEAYLAGRRRGKLNRDV